VGGNYAVYAAGFALHTVGSVLALQVGTAAGLQQRPGAARQLALLLQSGARSNLARCSAEASRDPNESQNARPRGCARRRAAGLVRTATAEPARERKPP
jgi:hypothetical protein